MRIARALVLVWAGCSLLAPSIGRAGSVEDLVRQYLGDLRPGTKLVTETRTRGKGHSSTVRTVAEVGVDGEALTVRIGTRLEGEAARADPAAPGPKVAIESIRVISWKKGEGQVTVRSWGVDDGKPSKPRQEEIVLGLLANLLPGFAGYCASAEKPVREESVTVPAGTFKARLYQAGESRFWVAPEIPMGGLVKSHAATPSGEVEEVVTEFARGP
ncbi:MAG: hypothetical protein HY815_02785 [Candidatus Riflebacteria bacterium]|nr:hypothetical protein [Candidatus Riflebacteria bacterium]